MWQLRSRSFSLGPFVAEQRQLDPVRRVPENLGDVGRKEYLAIAKRAQAEAVHEYTMLCIGLQTYISERKLLASF